VTAAAAADGAQPLDALIAGLAVDVPDFPSPGVVFRDLTPVFADATAFRRMIDGLAAPASSDPRAAAVAGDGGLGFDVVAGVEARGFLLAAAVALDAGVGVVPIRKAGKLPRERLSAEYELEYGTAALELHTDAIAPGQRVLLVDDVLATGGTLAAASALVEQLGGVVTAVSVVIELAALGGRERITPSTPSGPPDPLDHLVGPPAAGGGRPPVAVGGSARRNRGVPRWSGAAAGATLLPATTSGTTTPPTPWEGTVTSILTTGPVTTTGIREVLESDFAQACSEWAAARSLQAGKDTPAHRAALAEAGARIDAVLDMYLDARPVR
jgi:adenine phosphoribosyltransferase